MQSRIVLVSDDSDFFEYIAPKLLLRKYDELYRYSFKDLPDKLHLLTNSVIIVNSEEAQDQTLELLDLVKDVPVIVFYFNNDEEFRIKAYKKGMFDYITVTTSEEEADAKLVSALNISSSIEKSKVYREMLVKNNKIYRNNEVFVDYTEILDNVIKKIKENGRAAVLVAISPNEKTKFLLQANQIETAILNHIRKNDILMNFAMNKYLLLLYDTDIKSAEKIWAKIITYIPEKIYAGFAQLTNKSREYAVNEVLNKLHEAMNREYIYKQEEFVTIDNTNFKVFRREFNKKFERIITPVFYQIQQKYSDKLYGMSIVQSVENGIGFFSIKSKLANGNFKISNPGLSKINIDVTYQANSSVNEKKKFPAAKRIALDPDEMESGILEDLLEQFITEFKKETANDYT